MLLLFPQTIMKLGTIGFAGPQLSVWTILGNYTSAPHIPLFVRYQLTIQKGNFGRLSNLLYRVSIRHLENWMLGISLGRMSMGHLTLSDKGTSRICDERISHDCHTRCHIPYILRVISSQHLYTLHRNINLLVVDQMMKNLWGGWCPRIHCCSRGFSWA